MNKKYINQNERLLLYWDYDKNINININKITEGSHIKAFFICDKGHEWSSVIREQKNKKGCPYCLNKKVGYGNDIKTYYPDLIQDWDCNKNTKEPNNILFNSTLKFNWICKNNHESLQTIKQRKNKGCLKCNSIKYKFPFLLNEWDYNKNLKNPEDYSFKSKEKVFWICSKNKSHKWEADIYSRSCCNHSCPFCSNSKVFHEDSFAFNYPDLLKFWDYNKNKKNPNSISLKSNTSFWWVCNKNHSFKSSVKSVINEFNCKVCSSLIANNENNILVQYPDIAKEWDYNKNTNLNPENFTYRNGQKVWWKCQKGHEFYLKINSRFFIDNGIVKTRQCRVCSGKGSLKTEKFFVEHPELFELFDKDKNNNIDIDNLTSGSNKLLFWKCEKGHENQKKVFEIVKFKGCPTCNTKITKTSDKDKKIIIDKLKFEWDYNKNKGCISDYNPSDKNSFWWICKNQHSWKAPLRRRFYQKTDCPNCFSNTSKKEDIIFSELNFLFKDVVQGNKVFNKEIDIFFPKLNIGIEYDGYYWHKNKFNMDKEKYNYLENKGIQIINIRESSNKKYLKTVSQNDIQFPEENKRYIELIILILNKLKNFKEFNQYKKIINNYIKNKELKADILFVEINSKKSVKNPIIDKKLVSEWNCTKNSPYKIENISINDKRKFWWKCNKGHEWEASPNNRKKSNCPYCSNRKIGYGNDLCSTHPKLAVEWNYNKNNFSPNSIGYGSSKKVWWKCNKGHEWESQINIRSKGQSFCPICTNKIAHENYNLELLHKELSLQWDYIKNKNLKPSDFTPQSAFKVWWNCPNGKKCKINMKICDRVKTFYSGSKAKGCAYCLGRKIGYGNDLSSKFLILSKEWDYDKNTDKPDNIYYKSSKSVYWKCENGHSWKESIKNRYLKKTTCKKCKN